MADALRRWRPRREWCRGRRSIIRRLSRALRQM